MTAIPPPVSETAAWTEQDERRMQWWAQDHDESRLEVRFAREIRRLRADNERLTAERDEMRHAPWRRWSVQECVQDGSLLVCKGHHDQSAPCEFEEYIPKPAGRADIAAIGRTLSFFASAIKSGERWTDTCNAEQYNAMKSLAALRSELAAASRERETPPDIPDEVKWEVWYVDVGVPWLKDLPSLAIAQSKLEVLCDCLPKDESYRAGIVRSTTARSRVSDKEIR